MSSIILQAHSLTKKYRHTVALDHIDLQIEKGKIYGFIGQNGAGKTTFLRLVTGLAYSLLLNSATFFIAIWICFSLRNSAKAIAVTAVTTFVLSLYLGFGMMLKFPVAFLPTYQIREAVTSTAIFQPFPILIGIVWVVTLLILSWCSFRKCELK